MISRQKEKEFYKAFAAKDPTYDGIFFTGIKSTGIFCRPTCPARKAKPENCEFFSTAQESLLAGYRPCKRCQPLETPNAPSQVVQKIIEAIEADVGKRWSDEDIRRLEIDPSTARRQFKKRFGLTCIGYARARRMGMALKTIRSGEKVIYAQVDSGYESGSGFRDAFSKIMGAAPSAREHKVLKADWIDGPLGAMLAIADDDFLHLLEFTDRRGLEAEIETLRKKEGFAIVPGRSAVIDSIERELGSYFAGKLQNFKTPIRFHGSAFQKSVLKLLTDIPYGQTRTYGEQAKWVGKPKAVRAVARANGQNRLAIIIPCHRVIGAQGKLIGYSGGLARKQWLLDHERKFR